MKHSSKWEFNYRLLLNYLDRVGDVIVPNDHIEIVENGLTVNLGNWVSYMRTRYHIGKLSKDRIMRLESVPTWTWGPIKPGPKSTHSLKNRNEKIVADYKNGKSLAAIGKVYNLSRQRIFQIVKESTVE